MRRFKNLRCGKHQTTQDAKRDIREFSDHIEVFLCGSGLAFSCASEMFAAVVE